MKPLFTLIILLIGTKISYAQTVKWQNNAQIKQLAAQALQYQQDQDYVNAAKKYLEAFNLDTTNYEVANNMAGVLDEMKDYNTEMTWAYKAIALKPGLADAYISLGNACLGNKKLETARNNYNKAISLDPKNPQPVYSLGLIEDIQGNPKQALFYYEQSQKTDPDFYDARYNMAMDYNKIKDYANAYKYIDNYRTVDDSKEVIDLWKTIMNNIAAQPFSYPAIRQSGKLLEDFVAQGWRIKDKAIGDLNGDKVADAVLVLEYHTRAAEVRNGNNTVYSYPRVIVVLLKNGDHYNKARQQNTFLLREEEGDGMSGDPYDNIDITKGILNINYQYTRSYLNYKFRYQANDFYLIGATYAGAANNILFSWDFNFSTRKMIHNEGESLDQDNAKTAKNKTDIRTIHITRPKKLSELTEPFAWDIFKDVSI